MKNFRENGAVGALLDEYEKAILELQTALNEVTKAELVAIVDAATKDPDCRSIQTILNHVIGSGYGYAMTIRDHFLGEKNERLERADLPTIAAYQTALRDMFAYNERLFEDFPNVVLEELEADKKILVSWGQLYDVEQLIEHAIVHVLRHRRQIERFLMRLRK